jgi:beta-lactamase class A
MLDRRTFLASLALSGALPFPASAADLTQALGALEKRARGRLGVAAWDLETGRRFAWRGRERFRMCSTFKLLLAARTLSRVDEGRERLDRVIPFGREILLGNSPVTSAHVGDGLSVAELCAAAITVSDNGAANLLLDAGGGPAELTGFLRSLGDDVTRCDRREPELNFGAPADPRDTTCPEAILGTWNALLLGGVLSSASRDRLATWLVGNRTGDARLRAGLPSAWRIGDKTGNDGRSITNDIAIAWPPGRKPVLIAAFLSEAPPDDDARSATIAEVGRILVTQGFGA